VDGLRRHTDRKTEPTANLGSQNTIKNISRKVEGNCSLSSCRHLCVRGLLQFGHMNRILAVLSATLVAVSLSAQEPSHKVPVMDGGAGPCSLELTVIGTDAKPAYAATVKAHMAYGFGGIRRLDLEAGTNSDGKVKFIGLPARVHQPPLQFHASKDEFEGCLLYTSPSPRDLSTSRMPSSA